MDCRLTRDVTGQISVSEVQPRRMQVIPTMLLRFKCLLETRRPV